MGSGASTSYELSPEEKAEIAKSLQQKYEESAQQLDEPKDPSKLLEALKETYERISTDISNRRSEFSAIPNDQIPETIGTANQVHSPESVSRKDNDDFEEADIEFNLGRNFGHNSSPSFNNGSCSSKITTISAIEGPGKFLRAKTSSQLLSLVSDSVLDDQEKIANFISQLKSGEVQSKQTSDFRTRRLTFSQNTQDVATNADGVAGAAVSTPPKVAPKRLKSRTTIFASSEIGVVQAKQPPFPNDVMGTYSCHGIEPSLDEEDGIHEKINQDRGCVAYPYNNKRDEALLMCLDGHGEQGDKVSEFVMRQIVVSLEKDPVLESDPVTALKNSFIMTNTALMVTDIHYMTSGCTCVAIYVRGNKLYCANVGDSRAVMAWENEDGAYVARDLTRDHKPDDPEEEARITAWGGFVCPPQDVGLSARVYLDPEFTMIGLAMARSIGDHAVKAVGVIPEPEVTIFDVQPSDRFIVMASDGVWEFISSQEAVEIVQKHMHLGCHSACQELIETAAARWQEEEGDYRDDITAVIIKVPLPYTSAPLDTPVKA